MKQYCHPWTLSLETAHKSFREFEDVIDEVAINWSSYSSVQQAAIAKAFSGTRQQNRFIALMQGYNKVLELTETAATSAGTAVDKFNNSYTDSLEAKGNVLQASFESMIINSDFESVYAGIIEATTALVDFVNQTNALKGVVSGLAVSGLIKGFLAVKTGITESYIAMNKFGNALNIVQKTRVSTRNFDKLLLLTKGLSDSQMKMILSSKSLTMKQKELLLVNSGLSVEESKLKLQTLGLATAQNGLTAATTTLGNAFKGLWATLISNPIMLVTVAVSGAVMAYQSYNQKLEETRQKNIEASETAIEQANSLKDLYDEYMRLSSIQERTSSEEDAFKTVIEDVTKALGDKAEVLEGLTAGTNEYADALANATKEELQSASVEATIGRKSAEEEFQKNIWSDWSGSKVSIDSNSSGKSLSEDVQKAVDIVSDSLKEFETINSTWNNISWDISSDNPEEALSFYNALLSAREQLVLASESNEGLLDTEIYTDMNNAINAMSESLDSYISKRYEEEKLNYMAQHGIPQTTEEYDKMKNTIVETANVSDELKDKFNSLLMADFAGLANEIDTVAESVDEIEGENITEKWDFSETISQLNTAKEKLSVIDETYSKLFDEDKTTNIGFEDFSSIQEAFSEIEGLDISKYIKQLQEAGQDTEKVTATMQELIGAYLNYSGILENVTDENKELIITMLEEMGIANAEEIVLAQLSVQTEILAIQKQFATEKGHELVEATLEEITQFLKEADASDVAKQAIAQLALSKMAVNNVRIDTSADIENVIALANAAGASASKIANFKNAMNQLQADEGKALSNVGDLKKNDYAAQTKSQVENGTYNWEYEPLDANDFKATDSSKYTPQYKGGSATQKAIDDANKASKDKEKELTEELFDWIERKVKSLQTKFSRWLKQAETAISNTFTSKYYKQAMAEQKALMYTQDKAHEKYMQQAESVGLSDEYKQKIKQGTLDIESITDDTLKEQIQKYQEYYDKSQEALDSFIEAAEALYNLPLEECAQKIEKFEEAITLLDKQITNIIGAYEKNLKINEQGVKEKQKVNASQKAYDKAVANTADTGKELSSSLGGYDVSEEERKAIQKAIKNGKEVDLTFFDEGSEAYKNAIKYTEALKVQEKALYDLKTAQEECTTALREAKKEKFDNVATKYENYIGEIQNDKTDIDNQIAEIEATGARLDKNFYKAQRELTRTEQKKREKELDALYVRLENMRKAGMEGSDDWFDALDEIQNVQNAISECTQEMYELNNAITDLHYDKFNDIADAISRIIDEQEFLQGLFAHEKSADEETGGLTEAGIARLGSISSQYYASQEIADRTKAEIDELEKILAKGADANGQFGSGDRRFNSLDDLEAKIQELYGTWQDNIQSTYDLQSELVDVMKEKYEAELAYVNSLIDAQKEALQAEKDLHDYQRTIDSKVNDIQTIEKQIIAYQGDSSEEGMARLHKLQKELNEKKDDLQETEYDRMISDSMETLTQLSEEYSETISKKMDDFYGLFKEGIGKANTNLSSIDDYLSKVASSNGYTTETVGLFTGVSGSIKSSIETATTVIETAINNSDTDVIPQTQSNDLSENKVFDYDNQNGDSNSSNERTATPTGAKSTSEATTLAEKEDTPSVKAKVEDIFANKDLYKEAPKGKKVSDYATKLNQYLFEKNGKVLTTQGLKLLADVLGTDKNGTYQAMLDLKKAVGNIKNVGGFKTGGIAELLEPPSGEDGLAWVRNKEGFVSPEDVPEIQKLLKTIPIMNNMLQPLVNMPKLPEIQSRVNTGQFVQIDNITLPNVTNYQEFKSQLMHDLQRDKKFEGMVQDMSIKKMTGGGQLTKYRHRF